MAWRSLVLGVGRGIAAVLFVALALGATHTAQASYISGRLTTADGTTPVEHTNVNVYNQFNVWVAGDVDGTDIDGNYYVGPLVDGTYKVQFAGGMTEVYVEEWYPNVSTFFAADALPVTSTSPQTGINASLADGGSITGTVSVDEGGAPLNNITVEIHYNYAQWSSIRSVLTESDGTYTVRGLPAGNYYKVRFGDNTGAYATEWYDNSQTFEAANALLIADGLYPTPVNASLAVGGSISGTVTCAGAGVSGIQASAWVPSIYGDFTQVWFGTSGSGGVYTISGLAPGTYKVKFFDGQGSCVTKWYGDPDWPSWPTAGTDVVTAGGTMAGIDATLTAGGRIAGTIGFAGGGTEPSGVYVNIYQAGTLNWVEGMSTDSYSGWHYNTSAVPPGAEYRVEFDLYDGWYQPRWWNNKTSSETPDPVTVSVGATTDVSPTLPLGGVISGTIAFEPGGGTPTTEVIVSITSIDDPWNQVMGMSITLNDGWVYSTRGLPAGSYTLRFEPNDGSYQTYESTPVTVTVGDESFVNPTLLRGGTISGTIDLLPGGIAPTSVSVSVYRADDGRYMDWAHADAGSNWVYTTIGLPAGNYHLQFHPNGGSYLSEYWQDSDWSNPTPVSVVIGSTTDASPSLDPGGSISGTIAFSGVGTIPASVTVNVYRADTGTYVDSFGADAYPPQPWQYNALLPAGDYKVQFQPYEGSYKSEWWEDQAAEIDAATLTVTAGSTTTANPTLDPGGVIRGTIGFATADPRPDSVSVYVYNADTGDYVDSDWTNQLDYGWEYTTAGLPPGDYKVAFYPYLGSFPAAWWENQTSQADATRVTVADGATTWVNPLLKTGGHISGTINFDAGGTYPDRVFVFVYPTVDIGGPLVEVWTDASLGWDYSASLPPGDYKVVFRPDGGTYASEWWQDGTDYANALTVTVGFGSMELNPMLGLGGSISGTIGFAGEGTRPTGGGPDVFRADTGDFVVGLWTSEASGWWYNVSLVPGDYKLVFRVADGPYLSEWWQDATSIDAATPVTVSLGSSTPVSPTLNLPATISGTIGFAPGGIEPSTLDVIVRVYETGAFAGDTTTNGPGWSYSITGLSPGNYMVEYSVGAGGTYSGEYWENQVDLWAAMSAPPVTLGVSETVTLNPTLNLTPEPPKNLSADSTSSGVVLVWEPSPTGSVTGYNAYLSSLGDPVVFKLNRSSPIPASTPTFTEVAAYFGESRIYAVLAFDADGGNTMPRIEESMTRLTVGAPRPPAGVSGTSGTGQIDLKWAANRETDIAHYRVYRKVATTNDGFATIAPDPNRPQGWTLVGEPAGAAFRNRLLPTDANYVYCVTAVNTSGLESQPSIQLALTANGLQAPAGLVATPGSGQVELDWDDVGPPLDHYAVYRAVRGASTYTMLTPPELVTASSYIDEDVTDGTPYVYMVGAMDTAGAISINPRTRVSATPGGPAVPTGLAAGESGGFVVLDWDDNLPAVDAYQVYRSVSGDNNYTRIGEVLDSSYTDALADVNNSYIYRVTAVAAGIESGLSEAAFYNPPGGPVDFQVAAVFSENSEYDSIFPIAQMSPYDNGLPYWRMVAFTDVSGTPAYPVTLSSVPTPTGDLAYELLYMGPWGSIAQFSVGIFNDFTHPTYDGPFVAPGSEWENRTYSFAVEDAQADWFIPDNSLVQLPIPQGVLIAGSTQPSISWEPDVDADNYSVWIYALNANGNPGDLLYMSENLDAPSLLYDGVPLTAGVGYAIRVNNNKFHPYAFEPYAGDPAYLMYANRPLNRSSLFTRFELANLVQNPGFETGTLDNWNVSGSGSGSIFTDTYYKRSGLFGAWVMNGPMSLSQDVDVSAFAASIDAGTAAVEMGGYIGGFGSGDFNYTFLDAGAGVLGSGSLTGLSGQWGSVWELYRHVGGVPPATRTIRLEFAVTMAGSYVDVYWDDAFLVMTTAANAPPTTADNAVDTTEDTDKVFVLADFPFSDVNVGDSLQQLHVVTLPAAGILYRDENANGVVDAGEEATVGFVGTAAQIVGGEIKFQPAANESGSPYAIFTFNVGDGTAYSAVAATMTINVTAVNDAPSFTRGTNQTVLEDAGSRTVAGWATGISEGPADEVGQTLDFIVTNDNNGLFAAQPAIGATGTLTYTPTANVSGSATVTVQIHDNGGTSNGGIDTSAVQIFTITVTAVNDAPVLSGIGDQAAVESHLLGFQLTATDIDGDTLSYSASNLPAGATFDAGTRTFTWTPATGAAGTYSGATFTVSDGTATDSESITIEVYPYYQNTWVINVTDGLSETCVSTPLALWSALYDAEADGADNRIKVVQGTYAGLFGYASAEDFRLELLGGHVPGCASRVLEPWLTVVDGDVDEDGSADGVVIDLSSTSTSAEAGIYVDGFQVQNGNRTEGSGGCLGVATGAGNATVIGTMIRDCSAPSGGGLGIETDSGAIHVSENIVSDSLAEQGGGGMALATVSGAVTVLSNTVTENVSDSGGGGISVLFGGDGASADVQNNIVRGNALDPIGACGDVAIRSDADGNSTHGAVVFDYNDTDLTTGVCSTDPAFLPGAANLDVDPLFADAAAGDYHITDASPAKDAGYAHATLAEADIDGQVRTSGAAVDIGADEYVCPACVAVSGVSWSADKRSPQVLARAGTINFIAQASGGSGRYEYKFLLKGPSTGGIWQTVQAYGARNWWGWQPTVAGDYLLYLYVRNAGSTATYERYASMAYVIDAVPRPMTTMTLSLDKKTPQYLSRITTVKLTATGGGGTAPYEYRFLLKGPSTGGAWVQQQAWGTQNWWQWTPSQTGTYQLYVYGRTQGGAASTDLSRTMYYTLLAGEPMQSMGLELDRRSPQPLGATIKLTATGYGGSGVYEFRFLLKGPSTGNVWQTPQGWGTQNWWDWTPTMAGTYSIYIYARNEGSGVSYDVYRTLNYGVTEP